MSTLSEYVLTQVESLTPGDLTSLGTFLGIDPNRPDQGHSVLNLRFQNGQGIYNFSEAKGAFIRVLR
jgi:hypothetical protein